MVEKGRKPVKGKTPLETRARLEHVITNEQHLE